MNGGLLLGSALLGLLLGGVYGVMASGLALTFGVMRILNLGHTALVVLGAYLSYELFTRAHVDPFLGLLVVTPIMFVIGTLLEMFFLRQLKTDREALSLVVTWAFGLAIEGVLGYIWGTSLVQISPSYANSNFTVSGLHIGYIYLWGFVLAVVVMGLLHFVLHRTTFGAALRATTLNRQAAQLVGIDVDRVTSMAFGLGAAMAAVGGALFGMLNAFYPDSWYDLIGDLLIIIVLGGFNSIWGAFLASLVVIMIQEVVSVMISPTWADLTFYVVLAAVLIVRPTGFFGVRTRTV